MNLYRLEALSAEHDVKEFVSGTPSLDNWLAQFALRAQKQGSARTKVLISTDNDCVVSFYSIAPTTVDRAVLPSSAAGGLTSVPAYLLARLAVAQAQRQQGLGRELLAAALRDIVAASQWAGGRLIVVDAIDAEALAFYEHFGFHRIGDTNRLYERISAIS